MTKTPKVSASPASVTVSELLRSVRDLLEHRFGWTWVRGELSNVTRAGSGHWYFVLKDDQAQVDCVLFRGRAAGLARPLREGDRVEVRANVSLYEPRGRFQLTVDQVRPAGQGPLYERFLRLKETLTAQGLFDADAKRPLPPFPRSVGVVTSLTAAALRDVLTALRRRNAALPVVVYPVPVQGEGAAERIAAMLARVSARAECDVVLLVRGGGSIEDLWAFNEEVLARAIRASALPVVVGVGHETDFTIADFAADLRAPTPTAAAELVSPARAELLAQLNELVLRAGREMRRRIEYAAQGIDALARRLVHPGARLQASLRLLGQILARLHNAERHVLEHAAERLRDAPRRLGEAIRRLTEARGQRLERFQVSLASLDPRAVLERGYSITQRASGEVVRDAASVATGERLRTTLAKGTLESEVRNRAPDTTSG